MDNTQSGAIVVPGFSVLLKQLQNIFHRRMLQVCLALLASLNPLSLTAEVPPQVSFSSVKSPDGPRASMDSICAVPEAPYDFICTLAPIMEQVRIAEELRLQRFLEREARLNAIYERHGCTDREGDICDSFGLDVELSIAVFEEEIALQESPVVDRISTWQNGRDNGNPEKTLMEGVCPIPPGGRRAKGKEGTSLQSTSIPAQFEAGEEGQSVDGEGFGCSPIIIRLYHSVRNGYAHGWDMYENVTSHLPAESISAALLRHYLLYAPCVSLYNRLTTTATPSPTSGGEVSISYQLSSNMQILASGGIISKETIRKSNIVTEIPVCCST